MKDQYFGDVNDYAKYCLLRSLSHVGLSLGVCWMLTKPDGRTDGRHLGYLAQPDRHRHRDPELFDWLRTAIHRDNERSVRRVQKSGVLGDAVFQARILPDDRTGRNAYFGECRQLFYDRDLVFFDPDNGLECQPRPGHRGSSKYLYWPEVEATFATGASVLIYQHFPREERTGFIARRLHELQARTGASAVQAFRASNVVFLLGVQLRHRPALTPLMAESATLVA